MSGSRFQIQVTQLGFHLLGGKRDEHTKAMVVRYAYCVVVCSLNELRAWTGGRRPSGGIEHVGDEICANPRVADVLYSVSPKWRSHERPIHHPRENSDRMFIPLALAYTE